MVCWWRRVIPVLYLWFYGFYIKCRNVLNIDKEVVWFYWCDSAYLIYVWCTLYIYLQTNLYKHFCNNIANVIQRWMEVSTFLLYAYTIKLDFVIERGFSHIVERKHYNLTHKMLITKTMCICVKQTFLMSIKVEKRNKQHKFLMWFGFIIKLSV